jgi:hypothetical protein
VNSVLILRLNAVMPSDANLIQGKLQSDLASVLWTHQDSANPCAVMHLPMHGV